MLKVYVWKKHKFKLMEESSKNCIVFGCLCINRCGIYAFCNSLPHYRNLLTRQHLQCHRIIIWYHLAWTDINRHYQICPMRAIVVHHLFCLLVFLQVGQVAEHRGSPCIIGSVEGKIGLGARKKDRALFFREGVTASALNDRQISITTYKMIDRRYTSARFKDMRAKSNLRRRE